MNSLRFFRTKEERNEGNKYLKFEVWLFSLFLELVKVTNNFV